MKALELGRAATVTFGGQVVVAGGLATAAAIGVRDLAGCRRPRARALAALGAAAVYVGVAEPWMARWGTTADERRAALPGDELVPAPGIAIDHGVTIEAPADRVWPWLAQIGQDRGGFYSYEWLENLAGCRMSNADRIHPEWQQRRVGESVMLHPLAPGLPVTIFEPPRVLGLEGWGVFVVEPRGADRCRLLVRGRIPKGLPSLLYRTTLAVPHFVMERRMLLGIKDRAESGR